MAGVVLFQLFQLMWIFDVINLSLKVPHVFKCKSLESKKKDFKDYLTNYTIIYFWKVAKRSYFDEKQWKLKVCMELLYLIFPQKFKREFSTI